MSSSSPVIIHADLDAFYASVEQRDDPKLRGRPVVVGGSERRGVVSTASYEARRYGIHSAQPGAVAKRLCPHAIFVRPRMKVYAAVSKQVFEIFESFTPLVEGLSMDEAFLDVTGSIRLFGSARRIAEQLRRRVQEETQLTISVGIAANKYVAKVASDLRKPDGLVEVPLGDEERFLRPLPLSCLWGAGPRTREKLEALGLRTIGDLQQLEEQDLIRILGAKTGAHFHALSHGRDRRQVIPSRAAKSMSREMTFTTDLTDDEELRTIMIRLAEDVGRSLRRVSNLAEIVKIKFRRPDFTTCVRQSKLPHPTSSDMEIFREAWRLLSQVRKPGEPVRLIGVGTASLLEGEDDIQLGLFERTESEREGRVLETLDRIRDRFGRRSIGHGAPAPRQQNESDSRE